MTKLEFARLAKVNPSSISRGVAQGRIVAGSKGDIDEHDPLNVLYLARHTASDASVGTPTRKPIFAKRKRPTMPPQAGEVVDSNDDGEEEGEEYAGAEGALAVRALESRIALADAQRDTHRLRQAERLHLLVHVDVVRRMWGAAGSELQTGLVDLPDRVGAQIAAIVQAGGEVALDEVKAILRKEADGVLRRHREAGKAAGRAAGVEIEN